MNLSSSYLLACLTVLACLVPRYLGAPVPIPEEKVEEEGGLLLLVPTVKIGTDGQPSKREIDYELISIPAEIIKRTVRDVQQAYGLPTTGAATQGGTTGSIFISDLNSDDDDEIIVNTDTKLVASPSQASSKTTTLHYNSLDDDAFLNSFDDDLATTTGSTSTYGRNTLNLPVLSSLDLSKILSSVASAGLGAATSGANLAGQAKEALTTATRVGSSALQGGSQAVRWVLQNKATGLRSVAEFAGTGLQYAGRLSSAVLKVLLRIPGIKARVISDLIQAGQPLATAVSEVISESADDLGEVFAAQQDIFRDAIQLLIRLITDVLALKGRALASLSAGGLDKGANLITAGVKVGSAFVQTAGDVFSAVGRGVGELVKVASEANLPRPPPLPAIKFPTLPIITFPTTPKPYGVVIQQYAAPTPKPYVDSKESYSSKGTYGYQR